MAMTVGPRPVYLVHGVRVQYVECERDIRAGLSVSAFPNDAVLIADLARVAPFSTLDVSAPDIKNRAPDLAAGNEMTQVNEVAGNRHRGMIYAGRLDCRAQDGMRAGARARSRGGAQGAGCLPVREWASCSWAQLGCDRKPLPREHLSAAMRTFP